MVFARCQRLGVVVTALVLAILGGTVRPAVATQPPEAEDDGEQRVGVLIADHGEPPVYNQFTYWSFRAFFNRLMEMGVMPAWLKTVDTGTILQDRGCYGCEDRRGEPDLIDTWLRPHERPAAPAPGSERVAAHYVMPGGPGLGEPDIFEHIGLAAWHEWQLMGGRSPNYDQKLAKKQAVMERLHQTYGDRVAVRVGYGIDPRINGGRQGLRQAVTALINRDRVDRIVVAYHGVGFSDIMQTHMIRPRIRQLRDELDPALEVSFLPPLGTTDAYVQAVVDQVRAEVAALPRTAPVAIHLSEHGLPTSDCGDYPCGEDAYHDFARQMFQRTQAAIEQRLQRPGRLEVFQVYGDGGEGDDDPDDEVDSPTAALDQRAAAGFTHVVDVPYAFGSDSRDTLIVLRRGYRRPIPDWNQDYESHFTYEGMQVKITNSSFGQRLKTRALEQVIHDGLEQAGIREHPRRGHRADHNRAAGRGQARAR